MINIKQIKDLAREAWFDQQSQDNEGGLPCGTSFVGGFIDGFRGNTEVHSVEPLRKLESELDVFKEANKQLVDKIKLLDLQRENAEFKLRDVSIAYRELKQQLEEL